MAKRIELTEAEWAIIKEVWRVQPCAAPSIQEALQSSRGWSYSTVRTMMDRMVAKGILTTEKIRNLTLFRAAIKQGDAQKTALRSTLKKAFDGALTPLVQCLLESEKITPGELAELEKLIKAKKESK